MDAPDSWAVDQAIANWNAGKAVKLTRVNTPITGYGITLHQVTDTSGGGIITGGGGIGGWASWSNPGTASQTCLIEMSDSTPTSFRPTATTHEFGHCLGLDHTAHKGSIMRATLSLTTPNKPSSWDYRELSGLYR